MWLKHSQEVNAYTHLHELPRAQAAIAQLPGRRRAYFTACRRYISSRSASDWKRPEGSRQSAPDALVQPPLHPPLTFGTRRTFGFSLCRQSLWKLRSYSLPVPVNPVVPIWDAMKSDTAKAFAFVSRLDYAAPIIHASGRRNRAQFRFDVRVRHVVSGVVRYVQRDYRPDGARGHPEIFPASPPR